MVVSLKEPRSAWLGTWKRAEGFDGWDYFLTASAWKEACQGYSPRDVAKACVEAGILEADKEGKTSLSVKVPGFGPQRSYVIRGATLARFQERDPAA